MKKSYTSLSKLLFALFLTTNLFGFPVIASSSGQGNKTSAFEKIVQTIQKQYNVSITVDADAVNRKPDVEKKIGEEETNILKNKNVEEAINELTSLAGLQYVKLRDDYYIIKANKDVQTKELPEKKNIPPGNDKTITGTVTAKKNGETLPGVNVVVKGTLIGSITDMDGHYEISVPDNATTLVFSFLGYKTVEVPIADQTTINVQLEEDVFGLEEVVIAGVASATPRRNLSVSVTRLDSKELKEAPAASAVNALQGKVAGLNIVQANGLPGSGAAIQIRGATSLRGNQKPMIMLDGNILRTNLADINSDDIESVEVVKGAAAAALYGSEAGNGVIVIHTKRGKGTGRETTSVILRQEVGFQKLAKQIKQATHHPYKLADDWEDYPYTRYANIWYNDEGYPISGNKLLNNSDSSYADQPYARLYDHQDLFYENGMFYTTYLAFMGSSKASNFMVSYERNRQDGIVFMTGGYTRNNLRLNLDHNVSKKIRISTSNLFLTTLSKNPGSNSTFYDLLFIGPDVDLLDKNDDGTPYRIKPDPWSIAENPLYPLANRDRTSKRMSFIGNVKAFWDITEGLIVNIKYAYEYRNKQWTTYTPKGYLGNYPNNIEGSLYKEAFFEFNQNFQATMNYNKQIGEFTGKLKLSYLYENRANNGFWVTGKKFSVYDVPQLDWTYNPEATLGSQEQKIVAINYIGILDMDYKNKYIGSLQYRMDGSSLFGEEERWHPFFRVSGAYRISQDVNIRGIDELKVRMAYGNSGQRPDFSNQYEVWVGGYGYAYPSTKGNKYLKPSVTTEFEVGLNMEFLKRFSFEFTYSDAVTDGAIQLAPLPSQSGYPYQWQNVGTIQADVYEATLSAKIFKDTKFKWDATLLWDRLRQKITKMTIPPYNTGPYNAFLFAEGETFAVIYGYKWLRSLDDMAKQLPAGKTIEDYEINSDGYVVPKGTQGSNDEIPIPLDVDNDGLPDKVEIGNGNPNFNLSLNSTMSFKRFTFYFLLSWKDGGEVYNYTRQYTFRDLRAIEFDQYGKPANEKKSINYYSTFYKNTEINDYFIENGSYLKMREASLYYTFDKKQLSTLFNGLFKSIRLGFQAHNLFTITNYKGYDPEVASGRDLSNYPIDNFGYPNFRTFTGSIQITF
jgi:TonB-linked SusC/RagA family outer membrane protein